MSLDSRDVARCPGTPGRYRASGWSFHRVLQKQRCEQALRRHGTQRQANSHESDNVDAAEWQREESSPRGRRLRRQPNAEADAPVAAAATSPTPPAEPPPDAASPVTLSAALPDLIETTSRAISKKRGRSVTVQSRSDSQYSLQRRSKSQRTPREAAAASRVEFKSAPSSPPPPSDKPNFLVRTMSSLRRRRPRANTDSEMQKETADRSSWRRMTDRIRHKAKSPLARVKGTTPTKLNISPVGSPVPSPRSSASDCPSPLTPIQLSGALTVVVVGAANTGKTALIHLLKSAQSDLEEATEMDDIFCAGLYADLDFIEADSEKDDLWQSLGAAAFLVVFHAHNPTTQQMAIECLRMLRYRRHSSQKPVFLVGNHESYDFKDARMQAARIAAKRCRSPFVEVSTLLNIGMVSLASAICTDIFELHEPTVGRLHDEPPPRRRQDRLTLNCLRRNESHSCEDLLLIRAASSHEMLKKAASNAKSDGEYLDPAKT